MAVYSTYTDQELVALLKQDEQAAFSAIFERYADLMISFALRNLYDRDQAKDLVQDIFADLWIRRGVLEINKDFRSFLFSAVKNRIFDAYKHQKVVSRYLDHFKEEYQVSDQSTDHLIRTKELEALIEKEIAALPAKMRAVFELSRKEGLSRKEIAEELQLPEATVRTNMNRALKQLKERLGPLFTLLFIN